MGKAINPIGNRRLEVSTNRGKYLTQSQIPIEEYESYNPVSTLDDLLPIIAQKAGINLNKRSFSKNSIIDDYYNEVENIKSRIPKRINSLEDEDYPYTIDENITKKKKITKQQNKIIVSNNFEDIDQIEEANNFEDIELTEEEKILNSISVKPKKQSEEQSEEQYGRRPAKITHNEHDELHEIEQRRRKMPEIKNKPEIEKNIKASQQPKKFININKLQNQFQKKWGNQKL